MFVANSGFDVLITSAPATTVTFSVSWPTSRLTAREYSLPASIFTWVAVYVLCPAAVTVTVYVPTSRLETVKPP